MPKKKFLGRGGEVYADVPIFLPNQVVSTLMFLMLYQRIFQHAFEYGVAGWCLGVDPGVT